jgi:hypothetical protein
MNRLRFSTPRSKSRSWLVLSGETRPELPKVKTFMKAIPLMAGGEFAALYGNDDCRPPDSHSSPVRRGSLKCFQFEKCDDWPGDSFRLYSLSSRSFVMQHQGAGTSR